MSVRILQLFLAAARLSLHAVLVLLAPVVRVTFGAAVLLGVPACAVFELSAAGPGFPLLETLMVITAIGAIAVASHGLLALLQR